ncbi:MAG: metalloregulator ArsR/SmtB family transcription factor [Desulfuromonadales bacterium]|nr:metalloregulator ArsR/SmtB family transcription factor [Desulfuromonadales bacterium]
MQTEARIFKALADETRLRILALLLEGELCVCEIMAALDLPQSTVSRHLAYLRNSGWVNDRRQGVWMFYRLETGSPVRAAIQGVLENHLPGLPDHAVAVEKLRRFRQEQTRTAC